MNALLLAIPFVLAVMARRNQQAAPSSAALAPTNGQAPKPPKPAQHKPSGKPKSVHETPPHKPKKPGKAHGVNPDGTLKWDPKDHPAILLDTPAGPAELLKPQKRKPKKKAAAGAKPTASYGAPPMAPAAPTHSLAAPTAPQNFAVFGPSAGKPAARKPAPPHRKPAAKPAAKPVRQAPDVIADASNFKRTPEQAALDLYKYVTGAHPKWGVKGDISETIRAAEADMGGVPVQGIYGPLDRARGKALIGKNFPPRH